MRAFLALQTQWRVSLGLAGLVYTGLVYASFGQVMDALNVRRRRRSVLFHELRVMESAALPILNARKADDDGR